MIKIGLCFACVCPAGVTKRRGLAGPAAPALPGERRCRRHEQEEAAAAAGGLPGPVRQALWVSSPGPAAGGGLRESCGRRLRLRGVRLLPAAARCPGAHGVALFTSQPQRRALPAAPLAPAGAGRRGAGRGFNGAPRAVRALYFSSLSYVFPCVSTGQLINAKWNAWSSSSTRWWPSPAAALLQLALTVTCSETPCTARSAWRMTWSWTEVRPVGLKRFKVLVLRRWPDEHA